MLPETALSKTIDRFINRVGGKKSNGTSIPLAFSWA